MDNKKKNTEGISPEELWKKVSQQLSSKKHENTPKPSQSSKFDLACFYEELQKIRKQSPLNIATEIENSLINAPHFNTGEPVFPIRKRAEVPSFFPRHSFLHFTDPNFYKKFDLDTLFFIFYYFKGCIQQSYSAIRLKHYAWRYHLKYRMWFQRLDEPNLITNEYEKGEFLFFDYETTWTFMKKNDFVFEYFYLEHNENYY